MQYGPVHRTGAFIGHEIVRRTGYRADAINVQVGIDAARLAQRHHAKVVREDTGRALALVEDQLLARQDFGSIASDGALRQPLHGIIGIDFHTMPLAAE
ncbi:hypothetical protein D3C72_2289210 [compost metagenome]